MMFCHPGRRGAYATGIQRIFFAVQGGGKLGKTGKILAKSLPCILAMKWYNKRIKYKATENARWAKGIH